MASNDSQTQRHRSPAYPSIGLSEAVDRATAFWRAFTKATVPREVAMRKWGYESLTGASARLVAALKQFGLLEEVDDGIKITVRAITLATLPPTNLEYKHALRECLQTPKIYGELLSRYVDQEHLPDPDLLESDLVRHYGFNPKITKEFVKDFLDSVAFAEHYVRFEEPEILSELEPKSQRHLESAPKSGAEPTMRISNEYELPSAKLSLELTSSGPLTEEDLEMVEYYLIGFKKVIEAKIRRQDFTGTTP